MNSDCRDESGFSVEVVSDAEEVVLMGRELPLSLSATVILGSRVAVSVVLASMKVSVACSTGTLSKSSSPKPDDCGGARLNENVARPVSIALNQRLKKAYS